MAGKIPRSFIDDLIARIDIVDLIDARVPLKKAGVNYLARCPFHSEKTPSFSVNREKQFYHCFGCGAHGNAIGFLIEYERQSFVEAIETLADSLGLEVPREGTTGETQPPDPSVQSLYGLQERVAHFYARQLRENALAQKAVDYLKTRGVSGDVAKRYGLGYAPPGWRNLPTDLNPELLQQAGLIINRDSGGFYDRFRDRIMFPIRDRKGRVVGFGGRILSDESPKYLNSPETPAFKKHREVYGLYELLQTVRRPERIIVVEGYMDVIALAQHGITNVVATLGTATSVEHADLLFRHARELVFCFDGDRAGRNAAWKALEVSLASLQEGRMIRFLMLPQGHDPDTLVRQEGPEHFQARVELALPLSEYFFQRQGELFDLQTLEGRATLMRTARPLLDQLPPTDFRDLMYDRLEAITGQSRKSHADRHSIPRRRIQSARQQRPSALRMLLVHLVQNPSLFQLIDTDTRNALINDAKAGPLALKLFAAIEERPDIAVGGLIERFRGEPEERQVRALIAWENPLSPTETEAEFLGAIKQYRQNSRTRLDVLLEKSRTGSLDTAEREELRRLLSEK